MNKKKLHPQNKVVPHHSPLTKPCDFFEKKQETNPLQNKLLKTQSNMVIASQKKRKIIFKNSQSLGDILMLTAAIRDLKLSHPHIKIDVRTSAGPLWEHNPHLTPLKENEDKVEIINIEYPLVHESNEGQWHFIHGFRKDMENKLNLQIKPTKFKGDIHLSKKENEWISQIEEMGIKEKFWIIIAGGKYDFTAKWGNPNCYQKVVDHFKDKIKFVQCGEKGHWHPKLNNVIDLIGKTDLRQFIRLISHSIGLVCPVTFAMHAAAAIPSRHNLKNIPCVVIAGGREPVQWEAYPHHQYLHTNGCLPCCDNGGCWKSRCQKVGDGDKKDIEDTCFFPTEVNFIYKDNKKLIIPKCINMIKADDIIKAIKKYYIGKILKYNK